jgi:two-component system sensor histidine kinase HydH
MEAFGEGPCFIFVGLDARPLEESLAHDLRAALMCARLVGLVAFGGFVSLFWAHHARAFRWMLRDARAFASEVVHSLPLGLLTCDAGGGIGLANAAAAKLFAVERTALFGKTLHDLGMAEWENILHALEQGETILERETDIRLPDGVTRPVSLNASRILNEEGQFLGYLCTWRDMGEIRRLRRQLQCNEHMSALGRLAAGIAHEVRNPLSSIKGFAVLLKNRISRTESGAVGPKAGESGADAADMLIQEVERLNRVVSGLLDFAKPGGAKLVPTALPPVVEHALLLCASDIAEKNIRLRFDVTPDLPQANADADKLTQALLNIFLNAVQAMEAGGLLHVSASAAPGKDKVFLRVADTGKGIAPEVLPNLFEPYVTGRPGGTGLGLAVVHRIVEQHGGMICVESGPGSGTIFVLSLPALPEK